MKTRGEGVTSDVEARLLVDVAHVANRALGLLARTLNPGAPPRKLRGRSRCDPDG